MIDALKREAVGNMRIQDKRKILLRVVRDKLDSPTAHQAQYGNCSESKTRRPPRASVQL
jgi:hypothetical protein